MNPLFSIVLTTYNRSQLLPRAINSILQQTYHDFECIVVDDGSTDQTKHVLSALSDQRLVMLQHSENQGVASARNTALRHSKGEYICFLDDDDELLADYLQEIVHFLQQKTHAFHGLIWTGFMETLTDHAQTPATKTIKKQRVTIHAHQNLSFLIQTLFSGITIHRTGFERAGVFNPQLALREDIDMIIRLLMQGLDYASIPKMLIHIHRHPYPSLSRSISRTDRIDNMEYFLLTHEAFLNQHLPLWLHYATSLLGDYYHSGQKEKARTLAHRICRKKWFSPRIWELFLRFELKTLFPL